MKLPRILLTAVLGLALLSPVAAGFQERQLPSVTIGVVTDGPYQRRTGLAEALLSEIELLASQDFEARMPADKRLQGAFTASSISAALDQLLADPEIDLVVALGPVASHMAVQMRDLPKPLVAFMVIDADWQGAPRDGDASGVPNLNYIVTKSERDLVALRDVVPFDRVAILLEEAFIDAMPNAIEMTVVIADVPREVNTQLRGDGSLVDVDHLVANGYHGGTRCGRCGESLEQHETQEEVENA